MQTQSITKEKSAFVPVPSGLLQRACACGRHGAGGGCEGCNKKQQGMLQRFAAINSPMNEVPPIVHEVLNSPGQPLDLDTRAYIEPRFEQDFSRVKPCEGAVPSMQDQLTIGAENDSFEQEADRTANYVLHAPSLSDQPVKGGPGLDFSNVRIHIDGLAAESAQAIGARAYTVGEHIVFGAGNYGLATAAGQSLLAHELTHVIQQTGTVRSQSSSSPLLPADGATKPYVQRQPTTESATRSSAGVRSATPEEGRQLARDALQFLQGQGDHFALQTDRDLASPLRHLRTTVQNGLAAVIGDPAARSIESDLHTAYRNAVRTTLLARTRTRPGEVSVRTLPTLRELYEQHRDEILPFGLPQADLDRGADELSAELNAPLPARPTAAQRRRHAAIQNARQRLRVITSQLNMAIEDLFSTSVATVRIPLPARTTVRFSSTISSSLHHGLRNVAGQLVDVGTLTPNTTVMLALDLTSFGAGYDAYHFTHLDLGSLGNEVLIERQGTIGVEGLRTEQRTQLQQRFDRLGFRRGGGFSQDEFDQVLMGLIETPEARLSSLGNLRFERQRSDPAEPDSAAHYDQNAHTVRMFDRAYSGGLARLGRAGRVLTFAAYSVSHEVGHALDLSPLRTSAADTETAQQALLREFGTGGGTYRIPDPRDPERARYEELQRRLRAATTAERAARSRSGARWSSGTTSTVTDDLARGAPQPAFRAAALRDGGPAGRQMPTTYPNPQRVWQEYFAESFALYQTSPELLRRLRPNVYQYMEQQFPR